MSETTRWSVAAEELLARERERLGEPPGSDEVAAYFRGELSEAEAERVRQLLVVYPEAATEVDTILGDEEMARDWASIQRRISESNRAAETSRRPLFPSRWIGIAAVVSTALLAVLLVQSQSTIRRLTVERDEPRVHGVRHELIPAGATRGGERPAPYPLPYDERNYLLTLLLFGESAGKPYRLDIVEERPTPRTIWSTHVAPQEAGEIELSVPRRFLDPGAVYRLDLHHPDAEGDAPVASYFVRAEGPRSVDAP